MIWTVYLYKKNGAYVRFLGKVDAENHPAALKAAWEKWTYIPKRQVCVKLPGSDPFASAPRISFLEECKLKFPKF